MPVTVQFGNEAGHEYAVITLNGLEKRFPGMDKPASRRSIVPFTPVM